MKTIIDQSIRNIRPKITQIVQDLHDLTIEIHADEIAQTVSDLRNRINEPFMFVIAGEVKAGKSSFVNALLSTGKEICKVAPQPMTDTIQQIVYGENENIITVNPYLKKIYQPVEILKEIAIVDTPGTNSIVDHHQEITERFVPASDLIVFVFEAKNPYRQSAWDFFKFINKEWRRKVIFVLQQKDLMNESDLAVNIQGVTDYAVKNGIEDPRVFAVSAKMELENQPDSGFAAIRNFLVENITGGQAPVLKIKNNIATTQNINERIGKALDDRKRQYEADVKFREDIRVTLAQHEKSSQKQVDVFVENMLAGYDRITQAKEKELETEISLFGLLKRSFSSIFNKKKSIKVWADDFTKNLERDLQNEMQAKLTSSVGDLAESIQQMAKIIDLKIQNSQTILKNNHEIFSDIAERRANVLKDLQEAFTKFLNRSENFAGKELFPGSEAISPNLLTGSGIAVVGTIIMTVTNTAVLDITGGILTAAGVLFAGISTTSKRRKILGDFRSEIESGRTQISDEVYAKLKNYVANIREKLDSNFRDFDELLQSEEKQIEKLVEQHVSIENRLVECDTELPTLK